MECSKQPECHESRSAGCLTDSTLLKAARVSEKGVVLNIFAYLKEKQTLKMVLLKAFR
jgi:hypothetical protein